MRATRLTLSILLVILVFSAMVSGVSATYLPNQTTADNFTVLPIKGELKVNVFFYDVDLRWFGVRNLREFLEAVADTGLIRPVAKSQIAAFSETENLAPFEFDVKLQFIVPDQRIHNEYRSLMRSMLGRTPYQVAQKAVEFAVSHRIPLAWVDQTIKARDALNVFAYLTEKYYPREAGGYALFVFCSIPFMGDRPAIYYTFGRSTDSEQYLADFGISIFGGPWWGRYYYVDICSLPPARFLEAVKPIFLIQSPEERLAYLAFLIDSLIDLNLVKSTVYEPKYSIQTLIDVIIFDATVAGVGFDMFTRYFDPEMMQKAYSVLMPYNQFNVRMKRVDLAMIPELRSALEFSPQGILLKEYTAYEILLRKGVIEPEAQQNYVYVPVIVLVTTTNSFISEPGVLGKASPNLRDPTKPLLATAAIYYEYLITQGMTALVVHEAGHIFGLRHPHDDYDEYRKTQTSFFPFTYFTETLMSYSVSWAAAVQQELIFEGYYPMRTYWSIFDLDNIDRATIVGLLREYEANYRTILTELRQSGIKPEEIPELANTLNVAREYARAAVEKFKQHNYFNRLTFKGLGAQLETSFDYAFSAWLYTENLKNWYLPAIIQETTRLGGEISQLENIREKLRSEIEEAEARLNEARNRVKEQTENLQRLENEVNALRSEMNMVESRVADVRKTQDKIAGLEKSVKELSQTLESLTAEVERLRGESTILTAAAAIALAAGFGVIMVSRRVFGGRKPLPPPPPPPS